MLVLTRKPHTSFTLTLPDGQVINVAVMDMRNQKVRIGIDAPQDVKILRDDAKRKEVA